MQEIVNQIGPIIGGAAVGGFSAGYVAKVFFARWVDKHDNHQEVTRKSIGEILVALAEIKTTLAHKLEDLSSVQIEARRRGIDIEVMKRDIEETKKNINGLGEKVKRMQDYDG